jgi:DNA polymerase I-like protein with 3'-5' exonuclease and polymerase domains
MGWNIQLPDAEYYELQSPNLDGLVREIKDNRTVAIDTETDGLSIVKCRPYYWSISWNSTNGRDRRVTLNADAFPAFKHIFSDYERSWALVNAKFDAHMFANAGFPLNGKLIDVSVMHALLYEEEPHGLKDMSASLLGWKWSDFTNTFGNIRSNTCVCGGTKASHGPDGNWCKKTSCMEYRQITALDVLHRAERDNPELLVDYAANDAYATWKLKQLLDKELSEAMTHSLYPDTWPGIRSMHDYFYQTEVPFTRVLYRCERNGLKVNKGYLEEISPEIIKSLEQLKSKMNQLTGRMMKTAGPDLAKYFIDECRLTPHKMTKGGKSGVKKPSIDTKYLTYVAEEYPDEDFGKVAALLVEHGAISKQYSTYIEKMPGRLDVKDYVHARLNQDVARTGRLSCIAAWTPVTTEEGDKPASEVRVGDRVWTHTGRWRSVLRAFTKGWEDMYDVILCNGSVLTCTNSHKLLLACGRWATLKEIADEHLQGMGHCSDKPNCCACSVQVEPGAYNRGYRHRVGDYCAQCGPCAEAPHVRGGEKGPGEGALLCLEDGQQEPNAGKYRHTTPALEGGVRRRAWLLDLPAQGQEALRAPCSVHGGTGPVGATCDDGSTPHRQRPQEQLPGQPGTDNEEGASSYPLLAGERLHAVEIKEIIYRGRFEVHDFTVEEDASYAACGVFSHNSSDPNMQNVTTGEKDRFHLRNAFICEDDEDMVVADYSQLEMRLLAAAAQEPAMMEIFHKNWDIHTGNAVLMYNIPYEEIVEATAISKQVKKGKLPESALTHRVWECLNARSDVKNIGFGLNYGMKAKAMAARMGCSVADAEAKIERYMATYPAVRAYFDSAIEEVRECGYAFTLLGRRRSLPDIWAKRDYQRFRAERQSSNMPIQGTAAEVCKMAMINISEDGELEHRYGYLMRLQVHDEIVGTCPKECTEIVKERINEWMSHPFPTDIGVPLLADVGSGPSWGAAK